MSRETLDWLNTNVLVGYTGKRGHAWHHRAGSDNHYHGPIPVADVQRRLFDWEPVCHLLTCPCGCGEVFQAVSRSDNRHRMGIFRQGYQPHSYRTWLLSAVSTLLGDTMAIGSAGLLRAGAVAWISVEVPDNIRTPEGVEFRPHLLATTSFDGSVATTYKRVVTTVVCDNTRDAALSENGQAYRVKHTRNSGIRLADARAALAMVHTTADAFAAEVAALCRTQVTPTHWARFLDAYVPMPENQGRSRTMAATKRDTLSRLYHLDARCAPWQGTAYGVVQTVDTWAQHEQTVRGAVRAERNMLNVITGRAVATDRQALSTLQTVLA